MKTMKFFGLISTVLVGLALPAAAGPRDGGRSFGGGGFTSGGRSGGGGHISGGARAAPAFSGGGVRAAPSFRGAYFTGRSVDRPSAAPRFYYGGNRRTAVPPNGFTRSVARSTNPYVGRSAAVTRQTNRVSSIAARSRASDPRISAAINQQSNRAGSVAGRNRVSDPRTSAAANRQTAANRQSFIKNHASERHDGNWHRDWGRHHARFHDNKVFVFIGGFWWGLDPGYYPWDYYPYYDNGYPYDYSGYNPDDYSANPYDYYNYSPYDNDDQSAYAGSDQSAANATVSAVQSELAKLGYYSGGIDGNLGDQTEAAIAHYQEDNDLSVTGTVDTATLQSLGIR